MPAVLWVALVLSVYQVLCVVSMHFSITVSSSGQKNCSVFQKFLVSLKPPDQYFLLLPLIRVRRRQLWVHQSLWVSAQPTVHRIKVRRSCRSADWSPTSNPQNTESLVQVPSHNVQKTWWYSTMHEAHLLMLMKRQVFQMKREELLHRNC